MWIKNKKPKLDKLVKLPDIFFNYLIKYYISSFFRIIQRYVATFNESRNFKFDKSYFHRINFSNFFTTFGATKPSK